MKRFLTSVILLLLPLLAFLSGQITPDVYPDCTTSSFRLSEKFMDAYDRSDFTQAAELLEAWVDVCGLQEVTNRALLLVKLRTNDVLEADFIALQYPMLKLYFERRQLQQTGDTYAYEYQRPYFGFIPIGRRYDDFTARAFRELGMLVDPEFQYLRDAYANEPVLLTDLEQEQYEGTVLAGVYQQENERISNLPKSHYSLFAGAWIPLNEDNFLGTHPEFGFSIGLKRKRWNGDFLLGFRFLKSANTYLASRERNGPREATDKFFGGFLGVSIGYDLLQTRKSELQISLQAAGDGWDMLEETNTQDASSLFRFAISPGVQYRWLMNEHSYLGLYARYHHANYRNSGRIDFEVNPLSVGVVYGFTGISPNGQRW